MHEIQCIRRLGVLNVNDDPQAELPTSEYGEFLDIHNVNSVEAVHELLHEHLARSVDLFLIDIDMEKSFIPEGLIWGTPAFRPYGPLLALPFIGQSSAVFTPYSGFWGNVAVTDNGFVRVALSLLLTQIHGEPFSLEDVGRYIAKSLAPRDVNDGTTSLVQEAGIALETALGQYRKRLTDDNRIQLVDIDRTYSRLAEIDEAAVAANAWPLSVPFADSAGVVDVDVRFGATRRERIQLSSLFADVLSFRPPDSPEVLAPIYEKLREWKAKSVTVLGETLYESVVRGVLARCAKGVAVEKAVEECEFVRAGGNRYQVRRMAMALAWTEAWHQEYQSRPQQRTALVHELLGLRRARKGRARKSALGSERSATSPRAKSAKSKKSRDDSSNRYKRLLGKVLKKAVAIIDEPFRAPLRRKYDNVAEAYGLNSLEDPGCLSFQEKCDCQRYAQEELGWDPSALVGKHRKPYPRWMRDE